MNCSWHRQWFGGPRWVSLEDVDLSRLSAQYHSRQGVSSVDNRLMRDMTLRQFRSGQQSRDELCDASAELLRVATHLGVASNSACPICEQMDMVEVRFAFGEGLPPHGRAIEGEGDIVRLRDLKRAVEIYEVEVCTHCRWNYLLRKSALLSS